MNPPLKFLPGDIQETSFIVIDLKDVTLKLRDGTTPIANEIEIKIGEGNLTYSESRNIEYILDRGRLDEVREGDEVPMDIAFEFVWEFIKGDASSGGAPPSIEDAFKNRGNAAAWISTDADACRPFALDIILENVPNCGVGASADQEIITLPDFRHESLDHDLRAGQISVTGRCNAVEASVVRSAQPST